MGLLIDMIPVGQGDSFLLTIDGSQGEAYVLVDAGLPDAGKSVVEHVSKYAPTGLDMIIATHIDNDHVGGLATVLHHATLKTNARFILNVPPAIKNVWTPIRSTLEKYRGVVSFKRVLDAVDIVGTLSALANQRGMTTGEGLQGTWWYYGAISLNFLNPTPERLAVAWEESRLDHYIKKGWDASFVQIMESVAEAPATSAENDSSVVIEITNSGVPCALMTSDAGAAVLKEITQNKQYNFLKVPHHGSDTGLDKELVDQIRPGTAFISVGENPHGHPSLEILELLRDVGAKTYCSTKTNNCRRSCTWKGGAVSHAIGRSHHPNWTTIDVTKCQNNIKTSKPTWG